MDDRPPPSPATLDAWRRHLGHTAETWELRRELAAGTLPGMFHTAAAEAGDRPAVAIDGELVNHVELDRRAARAAGWLQATGVRPGDRALLCAPNSIAFIVGYLALLRCGAVVVPADAALTARELGAIAADAGVAIAMAGGPPLLALLAIAARRPPMRALSLDPTETPNLAEAIDAGPPVDPFPVHSDDVALLAYTSGTTGAPKGVPLTHANLLSSIRAAMLSWRWTQDDVLVHALPLTHQHGLGGVHATLLAGSRAAIAGSFDPTDLAHAVANERATILFTVPAISERMLASDALSRERLASLRLWVSGSAPLSPRLFERLADVLGAPPLERYGTTESGLDVSNLYDGEREPGRVGLPLPGVELACVHPSGEPVAPGEDGEIVLRGPQVFRGYRAPAELQLDTFLPGGWFRTGDVGRLEPAGGSLAITGRLKEVIISGGMNVYPREVELALEAHPGVGQAAVVGVISERWGEEVTAFVVPAGGRTPMQSELLVFARARLAVYKCPKRVIAIEALPVDAMGKVSRAELRRLAQS